MSDDTRLSTETVADCQPSLGLLTVNALTAAQGVVIPLECELFSLRGVALLVDTIEKVKERLNPELEISGISARCTTRGPCTSAGGSGRGSWPSATPGSRPAPSGPRPSRRTRAPGKRSP